MNKMQSKLVQMWKRYKNCPFTGSIIQNNSLKPIPSYRKDLKYSKLWLGTIATMGSNLIITLKDWS